MATGAAQLNSGDIKDHDLEGAIRLDSLPVAEMRVLTSPNEITGASGLFLV